MSVNWRFLNRRTETIGRTPEITGLCSGEIYMQLADKSILFRDCDDQLTTVMTNCYISGMNSLKFANAVSGDIPHWNGSYIEPINISQIVSLVANVVSGWLDLPPDTNLYGKYFSGSNGNLDWYNLSNWYLDSSLSVSAGGLPSSQTHTELFSTDAVIVNLDDPRWIQPKSIDSTNVTNISGVVFSSSYENNNQFSGVVYGNSSYVSGASFIDSGS